MKHEGLLQEASPEQWAKLLGKRNKMATAQTEKSKSRGNGPISITFIDESGKTSKRVPAKVMGVSVLERATGKVKEYNIDDLPEDMLRAHAAHGVGKRLEMYGRNTVKNNPNKSVLSCTDDMFDDMKKGLMYRKAESNGTGGGAGRPFDYDMWVEVMTATAHAKGKKLNEDQISKFVIGLKALSPTERKQDIKKRMGDAYVQSALKTVQAKRLAQGLKKGTINSEYDALSDL